MSPLFARDLARSVAISTVHRRELCSSNLIMVSTVHLQMLAIWLAAAVCTGLAEECAGESACSRGSDADDIEQTDLWLLQVHQNVSQVDEVVSNRSVLASNVTEKQSHVALAQSEAGRSLEAAAVASSSLTGLNAQSVFVDLTVTILIILLLGVLYKMSMAQETFDPPEMPGSKAKSMTRSGEIVPVPILCPHFQREQQTDHQFRLEVAQVVDDQRATFPIQSEKNITLLTVTLSEGRMMKIKSVHADGPGVLLRGASTATDVLMTVYSENGSYFGKVARGVQGGVVFYHMQKPCAEFKTEEGPLNFSIVPLQDPKKKIASIRRSDPHMHIHVKAGNDAVLLLGCILGIVCLEPTLVKLMARED